MCGKIRKDGKDIHPGMKTMITYSTKDRIVKKEEFTQGIRNGEMYIENYLFNTNFVVKDFFLYNENLKIVV